MADDGFFSLGQMIAGGDPRVGEKAFLEGLDTGSRVRARNASTESALQLARQRRNEAQAQEELKSLSDELGVDPAFVTSAIAGVDPRQFTGSVADTQESGFRETIADVGVPFEQRQAAAQAIEGKVVDPFQFGPGGELFADVFNPDRVPTVSETGTAAIGADRALQRQRIASARLNDEKRKHPERFKSSSTFNIGLPNGVGLGDAILDDIGDSTIPADIKPAEATGITGAGKAIANTAFDVFNANLPFDDAEKASNALTDLMTRTQITGQQSIPGRPSNYLMQQLATFGVSPNDPFRSDQRSLRRMQQTSRFLSGEIDRLRRILNGGRLTPSKVADHEDALRSVAQLKKDYDVVIQRFNLTEGTQQTDAGGSFTVVED